VRDIAIAAGLVAGLLLGLVAALTEWGPLLAIAAGSAPLGDLFVNAIRMVVIPLVAVVVFEGVARLGDPRKLGRLGGGALAYFWITTIAAILIGMGFMAVAVGFAPAMVPPPAEPGSVPEVPGLVEMLIGLVPPNPIAAAAEGRLLPLLVFTVLFGAAACTLETDKRARLVELAEAVGEALIRLVNWILWIAPLGVFGLAAPVAAESGLDVLGALAVYILAIIAGLVVFVAVVYFPAVRFLGRMEIRPFAEGTAAGTIVGFGATSSMAALPVLLESAEDDLDLSPEVSGLVLSLGASIDRAGSALFQGAAVVFLAHLYDVPLPPSVALAVLLAVFLASMTVAPIPSASIFTLTPALAAAGVPTAGLGLLLGIDRIPDMFRAGVNQVGHMSGAVVVERLAEPPMAGGRAPF
jgi:Na+/H+-dicarboxylate symporter